MKTTLKELFERREALREQLGDMICQHKSETAGFGDSWPGAQLEITAMEQHVAAVEVLIEAEACRLHLVVSPAHHGFYATDDDSYDGPPAPCGWGLKPADAIADLVEALQAEAEMLATALKLKRRDVSRRGSSPCQSESGTRQGALRNGKGDKT
jgi:hypothetical protein